MIKFKEETTLAWDKSILEVPCVEYQRPNWSPKFPLKHELPGANKAWSQEEWETSGFPRSNIPSKIPSMLKIKGWDTLIQELNTAGKLSPYRRHEMEKVKRWLTKGIPYRMTGPGTMPGEARHGLNKIETEMAVDKLAQFCEQDHHLTRRIEQI